MASFNIIEIKRLILLSFALLIKINVKKSNKITFWQKMKLSHSPNSLKKNLKSCSTWLFLKISSDGGDFTEMALFTLLLNFLLHVGIDKNVFKLIPVSMFL